MPGLRQDLTHLREEFRKGALEARVVGAQLLELVEHLQTELDLAEARAAEAHIRLETLVTMLEERLSRPHEAVRARALCVEVLEQLRGIVMAYPAHDPSRRGRDDTVHQR
jgi:hypothetical protein